MSEILAGTQYSKRLLGKKTPMPETVVMFHNLTFSYISMLSVIFIFIFLEVKCHTSPREYQYFRTRSSSTFVNQS